MGGVEKGIVGQGKQSKLGQLLLTKLPAPSRYAAFPNLLSKYSELQFPENPAELVQADGSFSPKKSGGHQDSG